MAGQHGSGATESVANTGARGHFGLDWHIARTVGQNNLRRRWRTLRGNRRQLVATVTMLLFLLPTMLLGLGGAFYAGRLVTNGDVSATVGWFRLGAVYLWLFVAFFGGWRAYASLLRPDAIDGHLTTISHRELLGGLLYAEAVLWGVPIVGYAVLAGTAFAVGAGSPVAALLVPVTAGAVFATALFTGSALALVIRNLGVRSRLLSRLRMALFGLLGVAYFGLLVTGAYTDVLEPLVGVLEPSPIGWFGDIAAMGTAEDVSTLRVGGALAVSLAALPALALANGRLAEWLWYADGVNVESDFDPATTDDAEHFDTVLSRVFSPSTVAVVRTDWTRARRAPVTKGFLIYPVLFLFGPASIAVSTGSIPRSLPLLLAFLGPWMVGAAFALNPLGNEGAVLPMTLLSDAPGRSLVAGHTVAGVLPGVPVTVLAVLGLGLFSPLSAATTVTLTTATLVLGVCAGPLAAGIGTIFPRFEAVSVTQSTRAVVPSILAFAVYSIVLGIVATPVLLAHSALFGDAITTLADVSPVVLAVAGTALTAVLVLLLAAGSSYYAVDAVERYAVD